MPPRHIAWIALPGTFTFQLGGASIGSPVFRSHHARPGAEPPEFAGMPAMAVLGHAGAPDAAPSTEESEHIMRSNDVEAR
jgi:hypothetical protein